MTCGCSEPSVPTDDHTQKHAHDHGHGHEHAHGHALIRLEEDLLGKNKRLAMLNRRLFSERSLTAINLMSSPGAGKTTLLEHTLRRLHDAPIHVIEGDQATERDAARIRAAGGRAVQINTGAGCHLDAPMVSQATRELEPEPGSLLLIENVGNLVCPALFDLGERAKVVIVSVTEGEDKPLKYQHMFRSSQLFVLSKVDLLPYVECRVDQLIDNARRVNPEIEVLQLSATKGDGMEAWCDWLRARRSERLDEAGT
jgi:hydrogenase nickel incorporation protein HypB